MSFQPSSGRLRVLIIAEAANPEWVSVPLIGWSLAKALGKVADVHIVTQIRNREAFLRAGLQEGRDFTAIDSERFARPLWALGDKLKMGEGKGWTMLQAVSALSYFYFERLVWQFFKSRLKSGEFDIVHRITPLSPASVSLLAKKCQRINVPFVLGPLNGGVPWPKDFQSERRREREYLSYIRSAYKVLPGRRGMLKATAAILAGSQHTASEFPKMHQSKVIYLPENAIDPERFSLKSTPSDGPIHACFIGRLVPYKGADMLIEAAEPLLKSGVLEIDIIGDGPMMAELVAQCKQAGVETSVHFHGWQAHEKVQEIAANCQLFAFPSVREFGGGVVLEAMALGIPPLIVDYAGPGELVVEGAGFKVPMGTRSEIIAGFRHELKRLIADPELLKITGDTARDRVGEYFTWDRKAEQILQVYNWVLQEKRMGRPVLVPQC